MTDYTNFNKFQVSNIVKKWMEEEGYTVHDYKDENTDINYYIDKANTKIHIGFHKSSKDSLIIMGKITPSAEEQNMLKYLKSKDEFYSEIKIELLRMNLEVIINTIDDPDYQFIITDIVLQKTLYFDGLTKDRFYEIMTTVFNCIQILRTSFHMLGKRKND